MIENQKLIYEVNKYENLVSKLKNENDNLNKQLIKANQIISSYKMNINNQQSNINEINSLNEIVKIQNREINKLQIQLLNCKCKKKIDQLWWYISC